MNATPATARKSAQHAQASVNGQSRPKLAHTTSSVVSASNGQKQPQSAPAPTSASKAPAPMNGSSENYEVPFKTKGKATTIQKVPRSSVTDVQPGQYTIIHENDKDGTALIQFGGEQYHTRGDGKGNYFGGRMVNGVFVIKFRFVADPERLAAKAQKKAQQDLDRQAAAKAARDALAAQRAAARAKKKAEADKQRENAAKRAAQAAKPATPTKGKGKAGGKKK